jgi:hypothetical protein
MADTRRWATVTTFLALALTGSCTSSSSPDTADAGPDGAVTGCEETIEAACAADCSCVMDWPSDPLTTFCALHPNAIVGLNGSCEGYRLMVLQGVDTASLSYYDAQTGKLTADVWFMASVLPHRRCIAGPSDFVEPSCSTTWNSCSDLDAGAGGSGAAGGRASSSGGAGGIPAGGTGGIASGGAAGIASGGFATGGGDSATGGCPLQ